MIATYLLAAIWVFGYQFASFEATDWWSFLVFLLLLTYFQLRSVAFTDRFNYSLSMVVLFPVIYLFGIGPGMVLAAAGGLVDGISLNKKWDRVAFNLGQLMLSAAAAGWAFQSFGGITAQLSLPNSLLPMSMGVVGYFVVNIGSVTLLSSLRLGESWWSVLNQLSADGLLNYAIVGYMGGLCALFTGVWQVWGAVTFGGMLVGITELLQMGLRANAEQNRREEAEEALLVDAMTGARNFRCLNRWLMASEGEGPKNETVLFSDIDDFKVFNDRYGHERGDDALKCLADAVRDVIRDDYDTLVRYGGEEFVVILPQLTSDDGMTVAHRIRGQLETIPEASLEQPLTVSVGLASRPEDSDSRPDLLRKADMAMYQAKAQGKNRCAAWDSQWETDTTLLQTRRNAI